MTALSDYLPSISSHKDYYDDLKTSWAEYEYVCSMIKTRILEIINNYDTTGWAEVRIKDATITILVKPTISINVLNEIEYYLGIDGKVSAHTSKKNGGIEIIFEDFSIEDSD